MRAVVINTWFCLVLAFIATIVNAGDTKGACPLSVDCPAKGASGSSFTRTFFLRNNTAVKEFGACKKWDEQADVFVDAYNALSRVHCDDPCFRRATGAKMLTKCGPDTPDITLSAAAVQQELTAIIEVYFEQDDSCPSTDHALDTAKNDTFTKSNEHWFKDVCKYEPQPWASYYDYKDKDPCCCPCDVAQPLAEDDLLVIFNRFLFNEKLACDWTALHELETPDDYCKDWDNGFPRVVLTEWTGKGDSLSNVAGKLETILVDTYNGNSFNRCDGRQIAKSDFTQVKFGKDKNKKRDRNLQASPSGFVTEYPQTKCAQACSESVVEGRSICRGEDCPDTISLFSKKVDMVRRVLSKQGEDEFEALMTEKEEEDQERLLGDSYSLDYVIDVIYDKCLCRTHHDQPGDLPDKVTLIDTMNKEIVGKKELLESQIGAIHDLTEYVPSKAEGHAYDLSFPSTLVYVHEGLCVEVKDKKGETYYQVDEKKVHDLVEVIRRSYNDMTIEECDKPLFRQLVDVMLNYFFKSDKFDCDRDDFVLDLAIDFRCHGHCDGHDPLFAQHSSHRTLRKEEEEPRPHATRNMVENIEEKSSNTITNDKKKNQERKILSQGEQRNLWEGDPLPEGLCAIESFDSPKSPTWDGWEHRVNNHKPSGHGHAYILWDFDGDLCRCETDDEAHYYGYHDWYTVNGIYVAPKSKCPSEDSVEYYMYDIYYC